MKKYNRLSSIILLSILFIAACDAEININNPLTNSSDKDQQVTSEAQATELQAPIVDAAQAKKSAQDVEQASNDLWKKSKKAGEDIWISSKEKSSKAWQQGKETSKELWNEGVVSSKELWKEGKESSVETWNNVEKSTQEAWQKSTKKADQYFQDMEKRYFNESDKDKEVTATPAFDEI